MNAAAVQILQDSFLAVSMKLLGTSAGSIYRLYIAMHHPGLSPHRRAGGQEAVSLQNQPLGTHLSDTHTQTLGGVRTVMTVERFRASPERTSNMPVSCVAAACHSLVDRCSDPGDSKHPSEARANARCRGCGGRTKTASDTSLRKGQIVRKLSLHL